MKCPSSWLVLLLAPPALGRVANPFLALPLQGQGQPLGGYSVDNPFQPDIFSPLHCQACKGYYSARKERTIYAAVKLARPNSRMAGWIEVLQ